MKLSSQIHLIIYNSPVNTIGRFVFFYTSFNKLIIGGNVERIRTYAFFDAKGKIYIPNSVTTINANALYLKNTSKIYTGVASKPDDWDSNWVPNSIEVNYSVSLEEFNNL